jgi:hypothetical protein
MEVAMKIGYVLLLSMIIGWLLPAAASAQGGHQRDSWYIGFGLGGGLSAGWEVDGDTISFDEWLDGLEKDPKISLNFKVGGTLSQRTLLGFDVTAVSQTASAGGVDVHAQINNYFLMMTHFPHDEGFFIRLGGGFSNVVATINSPSGDFSSKVNGVGALGGIGYALWLGKSFNLTLNLDHSRQWYPSSPGEPDRSQFTILYLGFDWY